MGVVFCKNLRMIPSERVRVNLMILLIFACFPHKGPSSSIVEEMLAIARLANAEIIMTGGIGLPPTEKP